MTRAHDAVVAARLRTNELADCVWWDKPVPEKDATGKLITKYLEMRTNTGLITSERLAAPLGPRTKTYYLTGVGTSPGQAAWVLEQATEVLLNFRPVVAGWSCYRMEPGPSQPVGPDPDVDNRYFAVDQWDLFTEPLPS